VVRAGLPVGQHGIAGARACGASRNYPFRARLSDDRQREKTMSGHIVARAGRPLHPVHAMLLAFPLSLFAGALLSDIAYARSYHVQWANFASWLIAGGVLLGALALLWALIEMIRFRTRALVIYGVVLAAMWVVGIVNALVHARDAWGAMPMGLYLSAAATLLALIAAWMGCSRGRPGGVS
jgi:uncharacterized membrane protein